MNKWLDKLTQHAIKNKEKMKGRSECAKREYKNLVKEQMQCWDEIKNERNEKFFND